MSRQNGAPYPGFDDMDDFLEEDAGEHDHAYPGGRDIRVRTGRRKIRTLPKVLFAVLLIVSALYVLNGTLLRIRHVRIFGNRTIKADEIAKLAGMDKDMGLLTVDVRSIRQRTETDPYLKFIDLKRIFPDTLVLEVRERAPCANVQGAGALYLVDEEAYVLQVFDTVVPPNKLPVVIGMQVSDARRGQQLISNRDGKLDEYCQIMNELLQQGIVGQLEQINLTDSNHLYLKLKSGFMSELGTANELMAKIGTLRAVLTELIPAGYTGGYIDVSIPAEAIYTPE